MNKIIAIILLCICLLPRYAQAFNASGNTVNIYSKVTTLTAAQIRALDTTPVTLVPAPGAGKMVAVSLVAAKYTFITHSYPGGLNDGPKIRYQGITSSDDDILSAITIDVATTALLTLAKSGSGTYLSSVLGSQGVGGTNPYLASSTVDLTNKAVELDGPGSGYLNAGPIVSSTLGAGGIGYAINDTFTTDQSGFVSSGDSTGVVDTVNGSGTVLSYHLTTPGTAYPIQNGIATTANSGVGTGLTINVTNVTKGDGTLIITVNYSIVDVS